MIAFNKVFVTTHIIFYNQSPPFLPVPGPYSSVCEALLPLVQEVETCQIPLSGFNSPVIHGQWKNGQELKIPVILGRIPSLKYLFDALIGSFFVAKFSLANRDKKKLVVAIDPLSCLPLTLFKNLFNYYLVYYCVDFNWKRFPNPLMQKLYKKADEISTRFSNQAWVVCQALKDYKKKTYGESSIYIPNSSTFNPSLGLSSKRSKTGKKMFWAGSFLTERQKELFFSTLKEIQEKIKPDVEFYFAPIANMEKFEDTCRKYKLKKYKIFNLRGRSECQKLATQCDVGIALYDEQSGSTEFIEPLKIWDFMAAGLPFIISAEPSLSNKVKKSGVAFLLNPHNQIPVDGSLEKFLKRENLRRLQRKCFSLAKEFDIRKQIEKALPSI